MLCCAPGSYGALHRPMPGAQPALHGHALQACAWPQRGSRCVFAGQHHRPPACSSTCRGRALRARSAAPSRAPRARSAAPSTGPAGRSAVMAGAGARCRAVRRPGRAGELRRPVLPLAGPLLRGGHHHLQLWSGDAPRHPHVRMHAVRDAHHAIAGLTGSAADAPGH